MHTANIITDNNASPTGRLVKDDSYFPPYSGERYEDGRDINAVISDEDTTAYERTGPTYLGGDPDSDEQLGTSFPGSPESQPAPISPRQIPNPLRGRVGSVDTLGLLEWGIELDYDATPKLGLDEYPESHFTPVNPASIALDDYPMLTVLQRRMKKQR